MNTTELLKYLAGKKTYLIAAAGIAYLLWCQHTGKQPDSTVLEIFGFLGLGTLRHGIASTLASLAPSAAPTSSVAVVDSNVQVRPPGRASEGFARLPVLLLLAGLSALLVLVTGCRLGKPDGRIIGVTQSVIGISIGQSSADAVPHIQLGYTRSQFHIVPTGTNIFAPAVLNSMSLDNTFSHQVIDEDFATGGATRDVKENSPAAVSAKARTAKPAAAPKAPEPLAKPASPPATAITNADGSILFTK